MSRVNFAKLLTGTSNGKEDSVCQIETTAQLTYVYL